MLLAEVINCQPNKLVLSLPLVFFIRSAHINQKIKIALSMNQGNQKAKNRGEGDAEAVDVQSRLGMGHDDS